MKKILPLFIILLCGCQAEYNIHISESDIEDNLFIYDSYENLESKNEDELVDKIRGLEREYEHYTKTFEDDTLTRVGYRYIGSNKIEEYDFMSIVRRCYYDVSVVKNNYITFQTSDEYICDELYGVEEVVINLTSDYEIIESNADNKNKDTHTWIINSNNDKPIYFKLGDKKSSNHIWIIIIAIILVLSYFIFKKIKQNKTI